MPLGVVALLFFLACAAWFRPNPRKPRPTPLSPELRAHLGSPLATWLEATRALRTKLVSFQRHTINMLREEPHAQLPGGRRRFGRDLDDVNFLTEVREARRAGQDWLALGEGLPASERARVGLELESFAECFTFPWRTDDEASRSGDRSPELRALLEQYEATSRALAELDNGVSTMSGATYRGSPQ